MSQTANTAPVTTPVKSINRITYSGWAACLLLLICLFVFFNRTNESREELQAANARNVQMEEQIANAHGDAEKAEELLAV